MRNKIEILKKRSLVAFSDLKRGINFSNNFQNYGEYDFINLLIDVTKKYYKTKNYDIKKINFIYHSDNFLELFSTKINLNNINYDVNHFFKQKILDLGKFSNFAKDIVFYFKFNSWEELMLEIYFEGEEINYIDYLEITKSFNKIIFEKSQEKISTIYQEFEESKNIIFKKESNIFFSKKIKLFKNKYNLLISKFKNNNQKNLFNPLDISNISNPNFYKEEIDLKNFPNQKIMFVFSNFTNLDIFKNKTENHILDFHISYYELSEVEIFKKHIKKANKRKINKIIFFDDGIKSFRIAFKNNNHWEFLNSDEQILIFSNYILEEKKFLNKNIDFVFDYEISNYIDKILKNYNKKTIREIDFNVKKTNNNYFKGNDNYFIVSNLKQILNNIELIIDFINNYEFNYYLESIHNLYNYEEFRIIEKELDVDQWNKLKDKIENTSYIDNIPTRVERIFENEEIAFYLIENKKLKFTIKYYYLDSLVYLDISFIDQDKTIVLNSLKTIQENFKKYNEFDLEKVYQMETKTGLLKIFLLFILFTSIALIALFSIFSTSLDGYFNIWLNSYNTYYFWVLSLNFIIAPIIAALPFYYVFKKFFKAIPFWKLVLIFYMVNFFIGITPLNYLPIIGLIWLIRKQGISSIDAFSSVLLVYLITDGLSIFINFTSLVHGYYSYGQITHDNYLTIILLSLFGIIWSSILYFILYAIFFSRKFYNLVIFILQKISLTFNLNNWYDQKKVDLEWNSELLKKNIKNMTKTFSSFIYISIFFLIFYFWWELLFYSSIKIVDQNVNFSFADSIGYDTLLWEMNIWIPIPGKAGVTEAFGITILENVLHWTSESNKASQAIFLYRWFGWYMYIWISSFVFLGYIFKENFIKKNKKTPF